MLSTVTSKPPAERPKSGAAVEVPPHGLKDRPRTTVYPLPGPTLYVYWPDRWQYADVRARQDWPNGSTSYQVELDTWDQNGHPHRVSRSFLWGPDSLRAAE